MPPAVLPARPLPAMPSKHDPARIPDDRLSIEQRSDGALVGENFATRRGLKPGDQFEAVGVRVASSGALCGVRSLGCI